MALTVLVKPASSSCNLKCDYCFYRDEVKLRNVSDCGLMSLDTLKNLTRKTLNYGEGPINYAFQGGEPMLAGLDFYKALLVLQKKYNKSNRIIQNSIQTNGTLITGEWAEFFKQNRFLVGVSLDGPEAIHDIHRKAISGGSYNRVIKSINILRDYNVDFNILSVVTPESFDYGAEIYSFFKEQNFEYIQFIPEIVEKPYLYKTNKGFGKFLSDVFNLFIVDIKKGEAPYIRNFENMIGALLGICPEACEFMDHCVDNLAIEADGSVYPCDFYMTDEFLIGNVNMDKSIDLKSSSIKESFLKSSYEIPEKCKGCEYFRICRGGCRRYRQGSDVSHYYCDGFKYFFDRNIDRLKEIADYMQKG